MKNPSFRQVSRQAGLSTATLSRALRGDPRVRPATAQRALRALQAAGYQLDPLVSAGMSKIRQGDFYRETLAWCGDAEPESMPWLKPLFASIENYGSRLGYRVEYFHFDRPRPSDLVRLGSIWRARGIRGVLLGPFRSRYEQLHFAWDHFAWIVIGHAVERPTLHLVGRDYAADIQQGLAWLEARGCRRPGFLLDSRSRHLFGEPLLRASLRYYHGVRARPRQPFVELTDPPPSRFAAWLRENKPDGLVIPDALTPAVRRLLRPAARLPTVILSPPDIRFWKDSIHFTAQYEVIGQSSVNLLHRLLGNREFGIPRYQQSVILSSKLFAG